MAGSKALALPQKIISGGQTGADRAALDWAIAQGIPHGGWCPKGRWAEDGPISKRYHLRQTPSASPAVRTARNLQIADATVIFSLRKRLSGGSKLTQTLARRQRKACLHLYCALGLKRAARQLRRFLSHNHVRVLNVAGPRAATEPEIGLFVHAVLDAMQGSPPNLRR